MNPDVYRARRERLLERLRPEEALIVVAAPEIVVGRDTELRYVVDAELFYLTGYREPEAVVVLLPKGEQRFTMFVRPRDEAREVWTGPRGGVESAQAEFGADAAYPIAELATRLPQIVADYDTLYRVSTRGALTSTSCCSSVCNARRSRPRKGRACRRWLTRASFWTSCGCRTSTRLPPCAVPRRSAPPGFATRFHREKWSREWQIEAALEAASRAAPKVSLFPRSLHPVQTRPCCTT
jgi:hypothetical protein